MVDLLNSNKRHSWREDQMNGINPGSHTKCTTNMQQKTLKNILAKILKIFKNEIIFIMRILTSPFTTIILKVVVCRRIKVSLHIEKG